jgi:hypothetical protein
MSPAVVAQEHDPGARRGQPVGHPRMPPRRAAQIALPLLGKHEPRLCDEDPPIQWLVGRARRAFQARLAGSDSMEESMAPPKGRVLVHPQNRGGTAHRQADPHEIAEQVPQRRLLQVRGGGTGGRCERPAAIQAPVAMAAAVASPAPDPPAPAPGTRRARGLGRARRLGWTRPRRRARRPEGVWRRRCARRPGWTRRRGPTGRTGCTSRLRRSRATLALGAVPRADFGRLRAHEPRCRRGRASGMAVSADRMARWDATRGTHNSCRQRHIAHPETCAHAVSAPARTVCRFRPRPTRVPYAPQTGPFVPWPGAARSRSGAFGQGSISSRVGRFSPGLRCPQGTAGSCSKISSHCSSWARSRIARLVSRVTRGSRS